MTPSDDDVCRSCYNISERDGVNSGFTCAQVTDTHSQVVVRWSIRITDRLAEPVLCQSTTYSSASRWSSRINE